MTLAHFGRGDILVRACGKEGPGLTTRMLSYVTCCACIRDVERHGIGGDK